MLMLMRIASRLLRAEPRIHFQVPLVREGAGWNTVFVLFGNIASSYQASIRLHRCDGRLVETSAPFTAPAGGYARIPLADLLAGAGAPVEFVGNAVVMTSGYIDGVGYVEYHSPENVRGGTHLVSGGAFRGLAFERLKTLTRPRRGTVMHLPVTLVAPEDQYHLALHNLKEANQGSTAKPRVSLRRDDGVTLSRTVEVPPNGSTSLALDELFGGVREWIGSAAALLSVLDDDHFIHGYYVRTGSGFVCDHLHWG